ncbi:MAG TPA: hypothetical protein VHH15_18845 [Actinophytocola sp.]|nr:hypothetical protein [Actinophytocola sp.]
MYKAISVVVVILALGGVGVAVHWLWARIVLLFVCCALGVFYGPRRDTSAGS